MALAGAQSEARALRHPSVAAEHIILAIHQQDPTLLGVGAYAPRDHVIRLHGTPHNAGTDNLPFTVAVAKALPMAVEEADSRNEAEVRLRHLLLALLHGDRGARAFLESLGLAIDDLTRTLRTVAEPPTAVPPASAAFRESAPVPVTFGAARPLGDLGNRRTDARLLRAILEADGEAARVLRDRGVDEGVVRLLAVDA